MKKGAPTINQAEVLTRIRKALGFTQHEFAARLGVDRAMIANIERGAIAQPRLSLLPLLVGHLNVNPYCLVRPGEPLFLQAEDAAPSGYASYDKTLSELSKKLDEAYTLIQTLAVSEGAKKTAKPS